MHGRSGRSPRKEPVITEPYRQPQSQPLGEMEALEGEAAGTPVGVSELGMLWGWGGGVDWYKVVQHPTLFLKSLLRHWRCDS